MIHDSLCPLQMDWHDTPCGLCNLVRRAREDALTAARDAVAAVSVGGQHFWAVGFRDGTKQALAAIDALRGER